MFLELNAMNRFVDEQSGGLTKTGCLLFGIVAIFLLCLLGQWLWAWVNRNFLF